MAIIVSLIDEVIGNIDDETVITSVGVRVKTMMKDYPLFSM
jgi:glycine/serine hydroxymethyltransferase